MTFDVSNTGERNGVAIPQIYVASSNQEIKLGGFTRLELALGKSATAAVNLSVCRLLGRALLTMQHEAFSAYDVTLGVWVVRQGEYEIRVGESSCNTSLVATHSIVNTWKWKGQAKPVLV